MFSEKTLRAGLIAISLMIVAVFLLRAFPLLLIPILILIPIVVFKKVGSELEEDDPADWWKKGKKPFGD